MEFRPIDLTELLGVVLGTSIVLVPVLGLTMRFAFKPLVEALGRAWMARDGGDRTVALEKRIASLERQLDVTNQIVGLEVPSRAISRLD